MGRPKRPAPSKELLIDLYINQQLSLKKIRRYFRADHRVVHRWFEEAGIPIAKPGARMGEVNGFWHGGRSITPQGYERIAEGHGGKLAHRLIWEQHNGPIPPGYVIHHKNHNKLDNRIENLEMLTMGEHTKLHHKGKPKLRKQRSGY